MASMKALVPDLAIVRRMFTSSFFVFPNARILVGDGRIGFVRNDLDEEIRLGLDLFWIGDGLAPDLVEGIGRIRNQLAEKDFLVEVERRC